MEERAVAQVAGMVRTLKAELEYNTKGSETWAWMINHPACLPNLGTIGEDGKVPFERRRGRRLALQRCVVGERVWYKPGPLSGRSKADDRMMQGRFVAPKLRTSEYVVVSDGESVAARTIKRMPEEDRWTEPEKILDVEVLPWDQPGRPRAVAVRPAGEASRVRPRAPRLPEAQRLQRARHVWLQGDEARAEGSGPLPGVPGEGGRRWGGQRAASAGWTLPWTEDVIGERATKRAILSYSKLCVGEAPPSPMSSGGAALSSSNLPRSASSGMAVDETVDKGAKRVR